MAVRTTARSLLALGLVVAGGACRVDNPAFEAAEPACAAGAYFVGQGFTLADPAKVDLLFVVDNSPGMRVNQNALASAMPTLVDRLTAIEGLDWRVGVTSTDLADQGHALTGGDGRAECAGVRATFVDRSTADPGRAAGCAVLLGESGSEFEQGFESARRAIEGGAEFLRDDARLVLVFFSSEDDCTAGGDLDRSDPRNCVWQPSALFSAEDFAGYFASGARPLSGDPVSVVAIVAPPDNRTYPPGDQPNASCTGLAQAWSGNRYTALTRHAGLASSSYAASICASSFVTHMIELSESIAGATSDDLCVSLPMSGAPNAVLLTASEPATSLSPLSDFALVEPGDACPNGGVAVARDAHSGAATHTIEVRFCTTQNPTP